MADDVKIPISVPGAKESKAALDGVADALHKVGDTAKRSGAEAAGQTDQLGAVTHKLAQGVQTLVGSYMGLQGVLKVLQGIREEHERELAVTLRQTEAMRGLLAISSLAGQRPEVQAQVQAMAIASGRPVEQVAPAYQALLSGTAGMAPDRQQGLMEQTLLAGKMDYGQDLGGAAEFFTRIGFQQPEWSPQQIGNLGARMSSLGVSRGEAAEYLPGILATGRIAGADPADLAGMFSFAARRGGGVGQSGAAVRTVMMAMMDPNNANAKDLAKYGFPAKAGLMEKIGWIGEHGKDLPEDILAGMGGRRGVQVISAIANDPQGIQKEIGQVQAALAETGNMPGAALTGLYGEVPAQRMLDQIRSVKSGIEAEEQDPATLERKLRLDFRALLSHRIGVPAAARWVDETADVWYAGLTGSAAQEARPVYRALEDLVVAGYDPDTVLNTVLPSLAKEGYEGIWDLRSSYSDYTPPSGQTEYGVFKGWLDKAGARPMQTAAPTIYNGGTHYHNQDKNDPAGKPTR